MRRRGAACLVIALAVVAATVMRPSEARAGSIGSLSVGSITGTTATLSMGSVSLDEDESTGSSTVYFKYRLSGASSWTLAGNCLTTHRQGCGKAISGLTPGTRYQAWSSISYEGLAGHRRTKNFTTLATAVTGLSFPSITTSSAELQVDLANPNSVSLTVYYRYRSASVNGVYSAYTSGSGTTTGTSLSPSLSGLSSGTRHSVEASLYSGYYPSKTQTLNTRTGASLSSVAASDVTGVSATATVTLASNPDTLPVPIYLRYKHADEAAWTTTSGSTASTSVQFSLTGLEYGRDYEVQASLSSDYSGATSTTLRTNLIALECTDANNPPVELGEIGIAGGATLTHQGSVPGTVADAPCVDWDSRSGVYFRFSVATGEAGAVKVEARRGTSTMTPDLLVRSGDAYTGVPLFQDTRAGVEDALAAGLVDAGAYTLQLRSGARLADTDAEAGGPYTVAVTRLQPEVTSASPEPTSVTIIWNLGAANSADVNNGVELSVKTEYREDSETMWTAAGASLSPQEAEESVTDTISGLSFGGTYYVRAAYTNADHYVESQGILTRARILLSGAPYGVEATAGLVDEATRKYQVRAAWETPEIVADDNIHWGYASRVDGGIAYRNESGREHIQETVFLYGADAVRGGVLAIEVNNSFECAAPAESETNPWTTCSLKYNGRDYTLPVGSYWSTPWSAPALVQIADQGFTAGTTAVDRPPDDAVVQLIDLGFEVGGVAQEDRPSHALSVVLCAAIALTAGVGIALRTGGMKLAPVTLGSGLFYSIFAGLGPFLFGVPAALVVVTVAAPVGLGGAWLMRKFTL